MSWKTAAEQAAQDQPNGNGNGPARAWGAPWSLAARLTIWYGASSFLLLLLAMGFLYWALAGYLEREDDLRLDSKVREVGAILDRAPIDMNLLQQTVELQFVVRSMEPILLRIAGADGKVLVETPGMLQALPAPLFHPVPTRQSDQVEAYDLAGPDARPFRAVSSMLTASDGRTFRVDAAVDHRDELRVLAQYRKRLWSALIIGSIACLGVGYYLAHRGMKPIEQMGTIMRRIRSTTLNERIQPAGFPKELSTLALTFNEMLQGLEDAFARLSRYSADIAHELRTPIHNLRGEAEVALTRARTSEEYREALGSCLEECVRLSSLIDSLLFIARAENPHTQIRRERVILVREFQTLMDFYEVPAAEAQITLEFDADQRLAAELDRNLFQRAVGNLIENAMKHTSAGGKITVSADLAKESLNVEVRDTGRGIPAEHLPHLFDRFYRVDATRTKNTGGLGLGLAIVKTIAQLHRGAVHINSAVNVGTTVTLTFPARAVNAHFEAIAATRSGV